MRVNFKERKLQSMTGIQSPPFSRRGGRDHQTKSREATLFGSGRGGYKRIAQRSASKIGGVAASVRWLRVVTNHPVRCADIPSLERREMLWQPSGGLAFFRWGSFFPSPLGRRTCGFARRNGFALHSCADASLARRFLFLDGRS